MYVVSRATLFSSALKRTSLSRHLVSVPERAARSSPDGSWRLIGGQVVDGGVGYACRR